MESIRAWIFKKIFSDWFPFKLIDGRKEEIAKILTFLFSVAALVVQFFPEYAIFVNQGVAILGAIASALGIVVAKVHSSDKKKYRYGRE
jgi:hypothetical protein